MDTSWPTNTSQSQTTPTMNPSTYQSVLRKYASLTCQQHSRHNITLYTQPQTPRCIEDVAGHHNPHDVYNDRPRPVLPGLTVSSSTDHGTTPCQAPQMTWVNVAEWWCPGSGRHGIAERLSPSYAHPSSSFACTSLSFAVFLVIEQTGCLVYKDIRKQLFSVYSPVERVL